MERSTKTARATRTAAGRPNFANLYDMEMKYAAVEPVDAVMRYLNGVEAAR